MRIRAVANGNVIEAHPDAAKELIEAGVYEAVGDDVPQTSEGGAAPVKPKPTTKRKAR